MTLGALLLLAQLACAATVKLAWDYTDEGQAGFKVYYGPRTQAAQDGPETPDSTSPAPYERLLTVTGPAAREATVDVPNGTWYFRVTAFGAGGESQFSNETWGKIVHSRPKNNRVVTITVKP